MRRNRITLTCDHCGDTFERVKSDPGRFCSLAHRRAYWLAANTHTCPVCGTTFSARPSDHRTYCSLGCAAIGRVPSNSAIGHVAGSAADLLWPRVHKTAECWLWTGRPGKNGYARLNFRDAAIYGHRLAWELATGETLTPDDVIGHTCDVRVCVRNDEAGVYIVKGVALPRWGHLFKGTDASNMTDKAEKGRAPRGEQHSSAKVTEQAVREIRSLSASGIPSRDIAATFGIDRSTVSLIARRLRWSHVE